MFRIILISVLITATVCDDLLSVVVIYRHGDRTPIEPYPNDPYKNNSYWPVGFGQLTNLGKMQLFLLGKWLRNRYNDFLPSHYSEKDFYIRSTDVDRTLMSAESNLAGLFPPEGDQIWNPKIPWQPIPIHTAEEMEDNLLGMKKPCPRYNRLLKELFETEFFQNISRINRDLFTYLTKYTGTPIDTLEHVDYLYSVLDIEALYNFTLPPWTKPVFPDKLKPLATLSFATSAYTKDLARLKTGPFFNEIIDSFINTSLKRVGPKFRVYSAHDITIANVLNTMGAFQYHLPPYASTILFELRRNKNDLIYLNIFYKNSSKVLNITLEGCDFDCSLDDFQRILSPIVISRDQWNVECDLGWLNLLYFDNLLSVVYLSAILSFLLFILVTFLLCRYCRRRQKGNVMEYTPIPNDEVA